MTRYNPQIGDELIGVDGRTTTVSDLPVDTTGSFDMELVELERPDGSSNRKTISALRKDLLRGRFAVRQEA